MKKIIKIILTTIFSFHYKFLKTNLFSFVWPEKMTAEHVLSTFNRYNTSLKIELRNMLQLYSLTV